MSERTIADLFGEHLYNFDIRPCRAAVVPIVFILVSDDILCSLNSGELDGGCPDYPGNDLTGIERDSICVCIGGVRVEYLRKVGGLSSGSGRLEVNRSSSGRGTKSANITTHHKFPGYQPGSYMVHLRASARKPIVMHKRHHENVQGRTGETVGAW